MTEITLPLLMVRTPFPFGPSPSPCLKSKQLVKHRQFSSNANCRYQGTSVTTDHLPRYFAKAGHVDANPNKIKKNGAGKGGW